MLLLLLLLMMMMMIRVRLDQLLIVIRSSLIVYNHVWSKTRLIAIIAKLEIIYTAWPHNGVLSILSLMPQQSTYMYRPINTAQGEQSVKMGSRRVSCCRGPPDPSCRPLVDCSLYLIPKCSDTKLPTRICPSTLVSHWLCLPYYAWWRLWSQSAVADVTIIAYCVRWSRQALMMTSGDRGRP